MTRVVVVMVSVLVVTGCAAERPVLYPNAHYRSVGSGVAQVDIDDCVHMAETHGAGHEPGARVVEQTVRGAVEGSATGVAVGAVTGDAGTGVAAGAAGGSARYGSRAVLDSGKPDSVHRAFVDRCLRDLGYQPIGWR